MLHHTPLIARALPSVGKIDLYVPVLQNFSLAAVSSLRNIKTLLRLVLTFYLGFLAPAGGTLSSGLSGFLGGHPGLSQFFQYSGPFFRKSLKRKFTGVFPYNHCRKIAHRHQYDANLGDSKMSNNQNDISTGIVGLSISWSDFEINSVCSVSWSAFEINSVFSVSWKRSEKGKLPQLQNSLDSEANSR